RPDFAAARALPLRGLCSRPVGTSLGLPALFAGPGDHAGPKATVGGLSRRPVWRCLPDDSERRDPDLEEVAVESARSGGIGGIARGLGQPLERRRAVE